MSTTNTENLILYSCNKLYNGSRYKVYQSGTNFNYDTWLANTQNSPNNSGNLTVYFKSISEPITIDKPLMNADTYTYGCITNGTDGTHYKKYYFFVDSITTDQNGRSTLTYSIDWWATEWANVNLTKGHITRNKLSKPTYMQQPYSPLNVTSSETQFTNDYCFIATYIPSNEYTESSLSYVIMEGSQDMYNLINTGLWQERLDIPDSDIKDIFVVPLFKYSDFVTKYTPQVIYQTTKGKSPDELTQQDFDNVRIEIKTKYSAMFLNTSVWKTGASILVLDQLGYYWTAKYDSTATDNIAIVWGIDTTYSNTGVKEIITRNNSEGSYKYLCNLVKIKTGQTYDTQYPNQLVSITDTKDMNISFTSNEISKEGLMDWNGNSIWECPPLITISSFRIRLLCGISHIMLQFLPLISNSTKQSDILAERGFCYDCRHPGLFVDSYKDYILKNRDYDVAMRQIQSEKQEMQAWASTAENVGFGMAFGGRIGSTAAGIGGVIEGFSTWAMNQYFDPMIQQQYDLRYQRMTDQISLVGDSITNVIFEKLLKKYTLTMDTATQTRYTNDVNTNGYYCDETTGNLQSLVVSGNVLQADNVTVEGLICKEGRQQIVYRLQNGVEFI